MLVSLSMIGAAVVLLAQTQRGRPLDAGWFHWAGIIVGGLIVIASFCLDFPSIRFISKGEHYDILTAASVKKIELHVTVDKVRQLSVQNDAGALDVSKPVPPFGPVPKKGASFYVGSWEVFQKKIDSLTLHYEWLDAPADFALHYAHYIDGPTTAPAVTIYYREERAWHP